MCKLLFCRAIGKLNHLYGQCVSMTCYSVLVRVSLFGFRVLFPLPCWLNNCCIHAPDVAVLSQRLFVSLSLSTFLSFALRIHEKCFKHRAVLGATTCKYHTPRDVRFPTPRAPKILGASSGAFVHGHENTFPSLPKERLGKRESLLTFRTASKLPLKVRPTFAERAPNRSSNLQRHRSQRKKEPMPRFLAH